mgnify:CR=1 FL=1
MNTESDVLCDRNTFKGIQELLTKRERYDFIVAATYKYTCVASADFIWVSPVEP